VWVQPRPQNVAYVNVTWFELTGKEIQTGLVEFAVAHTSDIDWDESSVARLAIPAGTKKAIQALCEAHLGRDSDVNFEYFVDGGMCLRFPQRQSNPGLVGCFSGFGSLQRMLSFMIVTSWLLDPE